MRPLHREVCTLHIIGRIALSCNIHRVVHCHIAGVFVALCISGVKAYCPGAPCINVSGGSKVPMLTKYKIVAQVSHKEASGCLLAPRGHKNSTASATAHIWHKAKRNCKWRRHILHHHIGRAKDNVLLAVWRIYHSGICIFKVKMRVLVVAGCIFSVCHIKGVVRHSLYMIAVHKALSLLRYHIGNLCFSRFKIIIDALHFIGNACFCHNRRANNGFACGVCGVRQALGKDGSGIYIVGHILRLHIHIVVLYRDISVIVNHLLALLQHLHNRVSCGREDRHIYRALLPYGIPPQRVKPLRIKLQRICLEGIKLQRVCP